MMWSTPVVNVASAAMKRQRRPTSSAVPILPRSCAASPSARQLAGREDADEVQLEQVAELFDRELVDRLVRRVPPGVVNQAVEPPVAGERDLDQVPEVLRPPHVA